MYQSLRLSMEEGNYKFYKMTSNKPNNYRCGINVPNSYRFGVLDTKTNIFHYNYIHLDFELKTTFVQNQQLN